MLKKSARLLYVCESEPRGWQPPVVEDQAESGALNLSVLRSNPQTLQNTGFYPQAKLMIVDISLNTVPFRGSILCAFYQYLAVQLPHGDCLL